MTGSASWTSSSASTAVLSGSLEMLVPPLLRRSGPAGSCDSVAAGRATPEKATPMEASPRPNISKPSLRSSPSGSTSRST